MNKEVQTVETLEAPVAAPYVALGVDLVPRVRSFGQGGLADLLALRRRERRLRVGARAA